MDQRFESVRSALWLYWQRKKTGRIPLRKLLQHLRFQGHLAFFDVMRWYLRPPPQDERSPQEEIRETTTRNLLAPWTFCLIILI